MKVQIFNFKMLQNTIMDVRITLAAQQNFIDKTLV